MKKLILSVTAIASFSAVGFAQGTITFDGSVNTDPSSTATSNGQVFINGVLDSSTDINAELLYSSTQGGTYSPVVTLLLSSSTAPANAAVGQVITAASDITFQGNGQFLDASGQSYIIPGVASGATGWFEVLGWLGGDSYANATGAKGATAPFSEVLSSASSPTQANISNMPALNLVTTTVVPEPSTLAMAGVGLASMLIFRRRNK